jgi:hypothetical protein
VAAAERIHVAHLFDATRETFKSRHVQLQRAAAAATTALGHRDQYRRAGVDPESRLRLRATVIVLQLRDLRVRRTRR